MEAEDVKPARDDEAELDELQGGTDDADATKILLLAAEDSGES